MRFSTVPPFLSRSKFRPLWDRKAMRHLGLIGDLGPGGTTTHYYKELVKAQAGELFLVHANVNRILRDVDWKGLNFTTLCFKL